MEQATERRDFYVYEHWRTDRDECFYVGKGRGKRAYMMAYRNAHHRAIQEKMKRIGCAIEVRIVASGLNEASAFYLEKKRIAFWRASGADLTNLTDGGDGPCGLIHSPDSIEKMRKAKLGKSPTREAIEKAAATRRGKKRDPEIGKKISAILQGRKKSAQAVEKNRQSRILFYQRHPEAKEQIAQTLRGRKLPDSVKRKLSEINSGKTLTEEHKRKIGEANRGKRSSLGMKRSPETRLRQSLAAQAREHRKRLLKQAASNGVCE